VVDEAIRADGVPEGEVGHGNGPAVEAQKAPVQERAEVVHGGIARPDQGVQRDGALVTDQALAIVGHGGLKAGEHAAAEDGDGDDDQDEDRADLGAAMSAG
jgi:hypothetical protein